MRVVAFNGSPRADGNTAAALTAVTAELEKLGIETEIIQVGKHAIRGCIACGACAKSPDGNCALGDAQWNEWMERLVQADGVLFGSPVYYAGVAGGMKSFMDRAFYSKGGALRGKVGASVVALRRSGGVAAFDQINHFMSLSGMVIAPSCYWNVIHGNRKGEARQDDEGMQIMRTLGKNMAWLLRLIEAGAPGIVMPEQEERARTNFIR